MKHPRIVEDGQPRSVPAQSWACLHCHSTASDGDVSPREIVEIRERYGYSYLALTDHDSIDGYVAIATQPWIIPGVELWIHEFGLLGHITVLFHPRALPDICWLLTQPRHERTIAQLAQLPTLVFSGCKGSPLYKMAGEDAASWWRIGGGLAQWRNLLGDRLYLEVQPHFGPFDPNYVSLSRMLHIPLVITSDSHGTPELPYPDPQTLGNFSQDHAWMAAMRRTQEIAQKVRNL